MLGDSLPRTAAVLAAGVADGTHIGAQIYVSLDGKPVADEAVGLARAGVPMTPDTLMIWFSMSKATAAVATAQVWERGLIDLDAPVATYVPEFGANGKEAITPRHLLTHTAGVRFADRALAGGLGGDWESRTRAICEAAIEDGWTPGKKAGYHPTSGMHMLGEIIRRVDGRGYDRYVRDEIFIPLGMDDSWVGMPRERYDAYGDRNGVMHNTEQHEPRPLPNTGSAEGAALSVPGGTGRGPMHDLGRLYEALLGKGELGGVRILSPQTVEAITARHRVGMFDHTFGIPVDWGLGFIIDNASCGRYSSPRTFGHGGARSSHAMCDPEAHLVMAVVCNGMPENQVHYRRMDDIASAIYQDLGLVVDGDPGRDKPYPTIGLQ